VVGADHAASRRPSIEARARRRQRARRRALPGAPATQLGSAFAGCMHMRSRPAARTAPTGPWSENSVHEAAEQEERDGQQQEAHRGECGQPELEGVERGELPNVLHILLHT